MTCEVSANLRQRKAEREGMHLEIEGMGVAAGEGNMHYSMTQVSMLNNQ